MSKIDKYKEQSKIANKIVADLNKARGFDAIGNQDPNNDKHTIEFYNHQIWDSDIQVWFHASYGYYGSSNGYSACSSELRSYLIKALEHYKYDIVNYIMEAVKHDEQKALLDCKSEAERILKEIDKVVIKNDD